MFPTCTELYNMQRWCSNIKIYIGYNTNYVQKIMELTKYQMKFFLSMDSRRKEFFKP